MPTIKDFSTKAFYGAMLAVVLLIVGMFFSVDIQKMMMRRFHWRDSSFLHWSLLQFVPSMYNFSNHITITPGLPPHQVNHFPLREITFNPYLRQAIAESDESFKVTLTSQYRNTLVVSHYELNVQAPSLIFKYDDTAQ